MTVFRAALVTVTVAVAGMAAGGFLFLAFLYLVDQK